VQEVMVSRLPADDATFLIGFLDGASAGEAVTAACREAPSFDLLANPAGMIPAGVFVAVQLGDS
jgi:hypothetical protein